MARRGRGDTGPLALRIYAVDIDPTGRLTKQLVARIAVDGTAEGEEPFVGLLRRQVRGAADLFRLACIYSNGYFAAELEGTKIYLRPGEEPPPGVEVHEGPRGGRYYYARQRSGRVRDSQELPSLRHLQEDMEQLKWLFRRETSKLVGRSGPWLDLADEHVRSRVKAETVRRIASRSRLPRQVVNSFVRAWAESSSDRRPLSLALQMAAAQEFGVKASPYVADTWSQLCQDSAEECEGLLLAARLFVKAVYEETQEFLRQRGVEELVLTRGMHFVEPPEALGLPLGASALDLSRLKTWRRRWQERLWDIRDRAMRRIQEVRDEEEASRLWNDYNRRWARAAALVERAYIRRLMRIIGVDGRGRFLMNPLSSWSVEPEVSVSFARQKVGYPVLFWTRVPRERVFALPFTGPGCLSEYEVVLLGGEVPVRWRGMAARAVWEWTKWVLDMP